MDSIKVIDANKLQEYKCHIMAYIHECEVRKVEQVHGEFTTEAGKKQEYNYILLQCDDVDGERIYLKDKDMGNLVIIELKRDGLCYSPVLEMLHQLHIHPHGFSKYCMGSALTNTQLPIHRFKSNLIEINKIMKN